MKLMVNITNLLRSLSIAFVFYLTAGPSLASEPMELRGIGPGCDDNRRMNLWDISADSPLIRNDMLKSNYCFMPTLQGMHVDVIERIGQFARVRNASGSASYLVYANDLRSIAPAKASEAPQALKPAGNVQPTVVAVKNTTDGEVYEMAGKPATFITVKIAPEFTLEFTIPKADLQLGYYQKREQKDNPHLEVGGRCDGTYNLFAPSDWYSIRLTQFDFIKKLAVFEISGSKEQCSHSVQRSYNFEKVTVVVSGRAFNEMTRPHTPKELLKKWQPFATNAPEQSVRTQR